MNPKDPDTLIQRGACLVELHRCEPAIVDMEKVFSLLEMREGIIDCSHLKSRYYHSIDIIRYRVTRYRICARPKNVSYISEHWWSKEKHFICKEILKELWCCIIERYTSDLQVKWKKLMCDKSSIGLL